MTEGAKGCKGWLSKPAEPTTQKAYDCCDKCGMKKPWLVADVDG
jgi:hypothetical protein